jgi:nitronate monooxygenase
MPLKTKLTEALGIEHPVIQGGMHYVGYAEMAAAVSNAGGLGVITALTITMRLENGGPEGLRAEIRKCKQLTSKPFGVNCTLLPALNQPDWGAILQVIIDEGVKCVETAGNAPGPVMDKLKAAGIVVIHKCVTIKHALAAVKAGADIISMDGFDCAGHPGEFDVGNWILLAKAGKALPVPFLASGGVGTGTQLAAALAMGACGVNMGTRFMATKECPIHENIKQALVKGDENGTQLVMRSLKNTERTFKNATTQKVVETEKEFPGQFKKIQPYVRGLNYYKSFHETGDPESSVWSCGQVMGLIDDVPTCKELLSRMMQEAEETLRSNQAMIVSKL